MKEIIREIMAIENEFFRLEGDIAHIRLHFAGPEELFDLNTETKMPMFNEDFMGRIAQAFDFVPDKYKLDIEVVLDDMAGYTAEELETICRKNILLITKIHGRDAKKENRLALLLCIVGFIFVLLNIGVNLVWASEGTVKEIASFILEILATVPFWGAADICFISKNERRQRWKNYRKRFHAITFQESGKSF